MATQEWDVGTVGDDDDVQGVMIDAGVALTAADRAQIDIQIATAKRYPREVVKAQKEAMALACQDEDTAGSMFYALPRKAKGKTVYIEGPSVRFAEVLVYCWGNIRAEARVVAIDETHVTAQGTCMDMERNIGQRFEVKRRITDSNGRRYNEDMITTAGNAACSIAFRNAVFKVIPFALAKRIYDAARRRATGGAEPIEARRQRALAWFSRVGAAEARVLALLQVEQPDDITEEHLVFLTGLKNAIQDGDTTVEQAFSQDNGTGKAESRAADIDRRAAESAEQNGGQQPAAEKKAESEPKQKAEPEKARPSRRQQRAAAEKAEPAETVDATTGEVKEDESAPEPTVDPKLVSQNTRYLALLVERGKGTDAMRIAFQKDLLAQGLVGSAEHTEWRKIDFMSAINELQGMGAGPVPMSEEDEYEAAMAAKEAGGEQDDLLPD